MKATHGRSARSSEMHEHRTEDRKKGRREEASASRRACLMLRFFEESLRPKNKPHAGAQFDRKEAFRRKPAATNTPLRKVILGKLMVPRPGRASFRKKRNAHHVGLENHATRGFVPRKTPMSLSKLEETSGPSQDLGCRFTEPDLRALRRACLIR